MPSQALCNCADGPHRIMYPAKAWECACAAVRESSYGGVNITVSIFLPSSHEAIRGSSWGEHSMVLFSRFFLGQATLDCAQQHLDHFSLKLQSQLLDKLLPFHIT